MKLKVNIQKINTKKCSIDFSGYLKLMYLKNETKKLNDLLSKYSEFQISFSNVSEIDLAALQYFQAYIQEAKKQKKKLDFNNNLREEIITLFRKSGINIKAELS